MLRVVGEEGKWFAVRALHRDDGELWIDRPAGAHRIGTFMTGMHVGPHVSLAERVSEHLIRSADPTSVECVFPIFHLSPTHSGGLEMIDCADDGFRDAPRKKRCVCRVSATPQTPHRGRCRVGVCRGYEHPLSRNSRGLAGVGFRFVDQLTRHHTRVDHAKDESSGAVVESQGFREERIGHLVRRSLGEHGVHAHRKSGGGDVRYMRAGAERGRGGAHVACKSE